MFFDGAFGTYYHEITGKDEPCEFANLYAPEKVLYIHRQYIQAGAKAIRTNTFGVNSMLCQTQEEMQELIKAGYELGCAAAKESGAKVFADIGYIDSEEAEKEYLQIANIFLDCGAKYFIFETQAEYEPFVKAIAAINERCAEAVIIVSFAVMPDGYTKKGLYYKDLIYAAAKNSNIYAVGMNCICGASHLHNLLKDLNLEGITFSAMPNSGYPSTQNGRTFYQDNAEYFAAKLQQIHSLGIEILGGCCGITPNHIELGIQAVKNGASPVKTAVNAQPITYKRAAKNPFLEKLKENKQVIALELDPPTNADIEPVVQSAKKAALAGCDLITVADSPLARTRADSFITAAKLQRESGLPVMPHLACRDRNQIAIKGALLGAAFEGLRNIFAVTGDAIIATDRSGNKGVFTFNSYSLISFINSLNSELFSQAPMFIGCALNINAQRFDIELKRAEKKIAAGAGFIMTQPVFSDEAVNNLKTAKESLDCKILAGILPVAGYKNALFLNNEISGITLPQELIDSLKDADRERAAEISISFCMKIAHKIKRCCDGYYIMTPLNRIDLVCRLIERIKAEIIQGGSL